MRSVSAVVPDYGAGPAANVSPLRVIQHNPQMAEGAYVVMK